MTVNQVLLIIATVLWFLAAVPIGWAQPVPLGWLGMFFYGLSMTIRRGTPP